MNIKKFIIALMMKPSIYEVGRVGNKMFLSETRYILLTFQCQGMKLSIERKAFWELLK